MYTQYLLVLIDDCFDIAIAGAGAVTNTVHFLTPLINWRTLYLIDVFSWLTTKYWFCLWCGVHGFHWDVMALSTCTSDPETTQTRQLFNPSVIATEINLHRMVIGVLYFFVFLCIFLYMYVVGLMSAWIIIGVRVRASYVLTWEVYASITRSTQLYVMKSAIHKEMTWIHWCREIESPDKIWFWTKKKLEMSFIPMVSGILTLCYQIWL